VLLAIDVGNTNTVLGLFEGERLAASWRIKTDAQTTADEMALTYRASRCAAPFPRSCARCG
jgi:type III pantothenate kinase